jgi:hypothetical protein
MTIEELALKIAKEQGSDALNDWAGLGEMLAEHELGDQVATEDLAEMVRTIHTRAWHLYAIAYEPNAHTPRIGDPGE